MADSLTRSVVMPLPIDLGLSWRELGGGRSDPTLRRLRDECLRAQRTPDGPATIHVRHERGAGEFGTVHAEAWGPGASWVLDRLPDLVGATDDLTGWHPERHEVLARYDRRRPGLRIIRSGRVEDVLVWVILGQKVTGYEAARGWATILRRHGTPAPGPGDMVVPPSPETWAALPDWEYRMGGVEGARAERIRTACARMAWLEESVDMDREAARERLTALPGIGPWTAGVVERVARGDADAVEVGDFHIPDIVSWNLAAEDRADDDRMLELLEPFAPHRGRAVQLIEIEGRGKPRYGARMTPGTLTRLRPPRR